MIAYRWPADFPPDCPPEAAQPADGIYYYVVKTDPPQIEDFAPLYHRDRERAADVVRKGRATQCETMGLSTFVDPDDAVAYRAIFPKIGDRIARLTLTPVAGMILPTPRLINGVEDTHHTWWHPTDYAPNTDATVIPYL